MWGFNLLPHWYSPRHKQYIQCSLCLPSLSLLQKLVLAFPPTIQMSKGKPFCDCEYCEFLWIKQLDRRWSFHSYYYFVVHRQYVVKLKTEILDLSCFVTLIEKIHPFLLSLKCTALYTMSQCADLHENVRHIFLLILKLYSLQQYPLILLIVHRFPVEEFVIR